MIVLTGDTHGKVNRIWDFCKRYSANRADIMVILGDAGINFAGGARDAAMKSGLRNLPCTLLCIHGNHEMRPESAGGYEEIEWHGGTVYVEPAYPNLLFAKDGEIYDIAMQKCITIGGAYSVDKPGRLARGWPWFVDEQPSKEIKARVEKRLAAEGWKVDFVFSHTCPLKYEPTETFIKGIDQGSVDKGSLKIVKTFEGLDKPLEGVPFVIVGQTAIGEVRFEAKTDKNGVILLENLPVGTYTVTELRSDLTAGYVLSPAQTATIEAGKTAEVKIENKLQKGSLKIVKTFEGLDKPLEGVPFLVVGKTVNGEVRFEVKTDKNGEIILKDLPVGTYTVTEQKSDLTASYVLAPAQTVTITAGNETILRITNQLAKGEIRVLKVDKETGKPLAGAMFGLYKNGKLIAEAQSGKDGYAIFKDVAFGEYEIKELSAPVGYNRSEEVLKAVVGKDGSVVMFEVTNERIPGEPVQPEGPEIPAEKPPKTGDSNTIVTVALVLLILAGGVVLWLRKRGKDEEEPSEEEKA